MYSTRHSKKIEKIAEVLVVILRLMRGRANSKTKLFKLIYLLDIIQLRRNSIHQFSGVTFKSYFYGPYSKEIEEAIDLLSERNIVTVNKIDKDEERIRYDFLLKEVPIFEHLSEQDRIAIRDSLEDLAKFSLPDILEIAYSTKEYKDTPFGEIIEL